MAVLLCYCSNISVFLVAVLLILLRLFTGFRTSHQKTAVENQPGDLKCHVNAAQFTDRPIKVEITVKCAQNQSYTLFQDGA